MRGVTISAQEASAAFIISTHTPHARRDIESAEPPSAKAEFLLTRLMRGVTRWYQEKIEPLRRFLLTRLMRGVT